MSAFAAGSMRTNSWRDGLRVTVPGGFNDATRYNQRRPGTQIILSTVANRSRRWSMRDTASVQGTASMVRLTMVDQSGVIRSARRVEVRSWRMYQGRG